MQTRGATRRPGYHRLKSKSAHKNYLLSTWDLLNPERKYHVLSIAVLNREECAIVRCSRTQGYSGISLVVLWLYPNWTEKSRVGVGLYRLCLTCDATTRGIQKGAATVSRVTTVFPGIIERNASGRFVIHEIWSQILGQVSVSNFIIR